MTSFWHIWSVCLRNKVCDRQRSTPTIAYDAKVRVHLSNIHMVQHEHALCSNVGGLIMIWTSEPWSATLSGVASKNAWREVEGVARYATVLLDQLMQSGHRHVQGRQRIGDLH